MEIYGDRSILSAERTALNFIQHLSGIATKAYELSKLARKYNVKIYDTRKTIPTLRSLQKYAVKTGKAFNHRFGLYDAFMIKDNHISTIKDLSILPKKIQYIRKKYKGKKIIIEVKNIKELKKILPSKPDIIMLDNMKINTIKKCITLIKNYNKNIEVEISGGINNKNIRKFLKCKPDRISIGALTHSVKSADISLEISYRSIR